ncbi:MAG TPA: hypothetical protein VKU41_14640 [Polyangiaceae bacterium]|nr:hypothetical protein [Polyangiaceae bacterium]
MESRGSDARAGGAAWGLAAAAILVAACDKGCGRSGVSEERLFDSSAAAPPSAPAPRNAHRNGFVGMMFHAAHDLTLAADERVEIDGIEAPLAGADAKVRAEHARFEADLAAGIRSGQVDPNRTRADFASIDWANQSRQDRQADALDQLHALLGADHRLELVTAVRARRAAHALRPPDQAPEDAAEWTRRRLERLTAELGLDDVQRKKVEALLRKGDLPTPAQVQASKDGTDGRAAALLTAFAADLFDARSLDLGAGDASTRGFAEREVRFLSELLPTLRPEQREKLARSRETLRDSERE